MFQNPDIFHIQWSRFLAEHPEALELINSKVIVSFRGAQVNYAPICEPDLRAAYEQVFPKAHAFHAVSNTIAREGTKYGSSLDKTFVIKPAIDERLMEIGRSRVYESISNRPVKILSIGRFHWKKGYLYALDALKILKDQGVDFEYTLVAKSNPEEYIFQIQNLGLEDHVTICEALPHKEVLDLMSHADIFLLPSVEEGIANVVLEALALGTSVVTTDAGGIDEVVTDGSNGYIVHVRQTEDLADRMLQSIALSPEQREAHREKAFETLRSEHVLSLQFKKFLNLYNTVHTANPE